MVFSEEIIIIIILLLRFMIYEIKIFSYNLKTHGISAFYHLLYINYFGKRKKERDLL
jgi:hypothetical protein